MCVIVLCMHVHGRYCTAICHASPCAPLQFLFQWRSGTSGPCANRVRLLCSFDDWQPHDMQAEEGRVFELARMVPGHRFYFMFEVDGKYRAAQDELYMRRAIPVSHEMRVKFAATSPQNKASPVRPKRQRQLKTQGAQSPLASEVIGTLGSDGYLATGGVFVNFLGTHQDELDRRRFAEVSKKLVLGKAIARWMFKPTAHKVLREAEAAALKQREDERKNVASKEEEVVERYVHAHVRPGSYFSPGRHTLLTPSWNSKEERMRRLVTHFAAEVEGVSDSDVRSMACGAFGTLLTTGVCTWQEDDTLEKKLELLHNEIEHERELQHKRSTIGRRGWERLKAAYVVRCMGTGV